MAYRRLEPWRHWLFWAALVGGLLLFLVLVRGILLPFIAGMAVAFFLDPVVDRVEKWGLGRLLATSLVSFVFFLIVAAILAVIGPMIVNQVIDLVTALPDYIAYLKERLFSLSVELSESTGVDLRQRIREAMASGAESAVGSISDIVLGIVVNGIAVVNLVSLLLITPFVGFFLLLHYDEIVERIDALLPLPQRATLRDLFRRMDRVLSGFVRGQASVCVVMAVYYAATLSLVGLQYGLVIGVVAGILTFIPFVGSLSGMVMTVAVALAQYDTFGEMLLPIGLYLFGQFIEGYFLTPRLVGRQIRLHDVWVVFAVLAGGALFGFWGALLAVPVAGIIGVLVRFAVRRYRLSSYYLGRVQE
ncbi:MAG TPA: AI-2E family transporter [Kiloniellales bacterium]|nr:AI-2E family transporter [Kiloniellales bacterium]